MVKTTWLVAAGLTVSCCVAEPTPLIVAVMVGVAATESVYRKLAVDAPAGIVNGDAGVNVPLAEVVLKPTLSAGQSRLTVFPNVSSSATVIVPEATPAVSVCGVVVKTSWLAAAGLTVSCCVAEARPAAAAVSVRRPRGRVLVLEADGAGARGNGQRRRGRKCALGEVVLKFTATAPLALTGFPKASSIATVIVPDATPAVSVCGPVVNTS